MSNYEKCCHNKHVVHLHISVGAFQHFLMNSTSILRALLCKVHALLFQNEWVDKKPTERLTVRLSQQNYICLRHLLLYCTECVELSSNKREDLVITTDHRQYVQLPQRMSNLKHGCLFLHSIFLHGNKYGGPWTTGPIT